MFQTIWAEGLIARTFENLDFEIKKSIYQCLPTVTGKIAIDYLVRI